MKKFKKLFPIIVFSIILVVGIILSIISFKQNNSELEDFLINMDIMKPNQIKINWYYLGLIIIGFFGDVICIATLMFNHKVEKENKGKEFDQKIKNAFSTVTNKENKDNSKVTCQYCKCKYNKSESKCPNCGAPPEPCD